jgi:hypothetical protein
MNGETYRHFAIGVGRTTPAVYTAWKSPSQLTRRVISRMRTGASRWLRSFLCTQRKLISTSSWFFSPIRSVAGIAEINPRSFLLPPLCRTAAYHTALHPGGCRALHNHTGHTITRFNGPIWPCLAHAVPHVLSGTASTLQGQCTCIHHHKQCHINTTEYTPPQLALTYHLRKLRE